MGIHIYGRSANELRGNWKKNCAQNTSNEKGESENSNLSDDAQTLLEFPDCSQVTIVTIHVLPHGHIKLDLPADDQQRGQQ